jgi:circadian clock protein KaiB
MTARPLKKATLKLRLYVAGNAANSLQAIANIRAICDEHFDAGPVEIVDLLEFPTRGLDDGIVVTPTLMRLFPRPIQKIIGNLSDTRKVIMALSFK